MTTQPATTHRDPDCEMLLDKADVAGDSVYDGEEHDFLVARCKASSRNRGEYVTRPLT